VNNQLALDLINSNNSDLLYPTFDFPSWLIDLGMDDNLLGKIAEAIAVIQLLPKDKKYSISFSGGKDSHAVLALYNLYLKLGNQPLDMSVIFADTHLETVDLYFLIDKAREFCQAIGVEFLTLHGNHSFWHYQFIRGY
jgi:tRNA(Ile)-lysidine synthase TilS/MesJ